MYCSKTDSLYSLYIDCNYTVTSDSRSVQGGEMFFALRGENFDGNDYALQALEKGAAWAVVNDDINAEDPRLIKVADPFAALQQLATEHRLAAMKNKPLIGLTGTNGKTTTKELISAVLAKKFKVTSTQGNLNNDIGVPLSLLKIRPDTEIAVIEMGANHPDDIAKLVKVCRPDCGLITNVGKAHLLGFGSFEGVKAAKGELYKWLGKQEASTIFLHKDDSDLCEMAEAEHCRIVAYGMQQQGAKLLQTSADEPFLGLELDGVKIRTRLVGAYNAANVLAAIAVGEHFGVSREAAIEAIEAYCPKNQRSQLTKTERNTLIVDAYNANPSSMAAALDNFAAMEAESRIALLGDMLELGEDSVKEHVRILEKIQQSGIDAMLVGNEFRKAIEQSGISVLGWFENSEALAERLRHDSISGGVLLIKGSRGIRMEKVLPEL